MTPEENEDRQAKRALKRERARDARLVAELAVVLWNARPGYKPAEAVEQAVEFLSLATISLAAE